MAETIVVVGAGLMGSGIARVLILSGFRVVLTDVDPGLLSESESGIVAGLKRMVEKKELEQSHFERAVPLLETALDPLTKAAGALMVIEAVPEDLQLKKRVLSGISEVAGRETVIATNTSQLSVTDIASSCTFPSRVIGMHWFNPPHVMKLVEIVKGEETSPHAILKAKEVAARAGKEVVVVLDRQGFITTRVLTAFLLECYRVYEEKVATLEEIDKAVKLAFLHPMGPFELSDLIGLDTILQASRGLREALGERFTPPQTLVRLVEANRLGGKAGEGFYPGKR